MSDQKRVLILTADIGFGHRSAAKAVKAALQETYGERCRVEIVNPLDDERTPAMLRDSQTDYDRMVREMPDLYKLRYQISGSPIPNTIVKRLHGYALPDHRTSGATAGCGRHYASIFPLRSSAVIATGKECQSLPLPLTGLSSPFMVQ
jgi:hypothetical protein